MMHIKNIIRIAKPLRAVIGAHHKLAQSYCEREIYQRSQADSDLAVQQAKYLIMHLASRHDAVRFAYAVGMQGYINMR